MRINTPFKKKLSILALGAESAGNFCVFQNGQVYFSPDFGDLLEEANWKKYQKAVLDCLKEKKLKPDVVLTDLHPDFRTTIWGKTLAKKFKAKHVSVQHHLAHAFSSIGDRMVFPKSYKLEANSYSIVMDGTGLGTDGFIWGGEVFFLKANSYKLIAIKRIGHLENQIMIGGNLAIQEPARMLISILSKFLNKQEVYTFTKETYSQNEFELLWNQLDQKFNCQETSSTGRILDAVSFLLGFCQNERNYKHEPTILLEKNSGKPYQDLDPVIKDNILLTTPLFEYLIKNLHKDKKHLAATAQIYLAQGLYEIALKCHSRPDRESSHLSFYTSGGLSTNKIISSFFKSKNVRINKKLPAGDAGISFGQAIYYFLFDNKNN